MVTESIQVLRNTYPFPAIVGQDRVKKALLCSIISDDINGVLIMGGAGTAKSTVVRSLVSIAPDLKLHNVPINVGEERLVGGMDMEYAIRSGQKRYQPGILKEIEDGLLYLDEINLFEENIVHKILDAAERRVNEVEREGISGTHSCHFKFVGSMDPAEGGLSAHLLDRFDICLEMENIQDRDDRIEILRRRLLHESSPQELLTDHQDELQRLFQCIRRGKERLPYVIFPDCFYDTVSKLCLELNVQGHRGDMAMVRVAKALAALDDRDQVQLDNLHEAASLCLQHRRQDSENDQNGESQSQNNELKDERTPGKDCLPPPEPPEDSRPHSENDSGVSGKEDVFSVGDPFVVIDFLKPTDRMGKMGNRKGKRGSLKQTEGFGRCTSFRIPNGTVNGVAMVPTIRAAAPYQKFRQKENLAIALEKSDLREKVRTSRNGTTMLFLVDSSGSMGARRRMVAVKGAILSLLKDAYQKRDSVGLMSFRKDSAELLLPPTKSTDLAFHKLRQMPTGGKTPLALGLSKAGMLLSSDRMKEKDDRVLVIVSDGRANVPMQDGDAFQEALQVAEKLSKLPVKFVVVDSGSTFPRIDRAERLCAALGGTYFRLEDLNSDALASSLKLAVHGHV